MYDDLDMDEVREILNRAANSEQRKYLLAHGLIIQNSDGSYELATEGVIGGTVYPLEWCIVTLDGGERKLIYEPK